MADQSIRAVEYSNLIAFKRQELKKGAKLVDDDDGLGSQYKKRSGSKSIIPDAIKSVYSKKVPKDVLEMNDKLG